MMGYTIWLLGTMLALDLISVRQEPNLERRSDLALDHANEALDAARDAFQANDTAKMQAALDEVTESVNLSYQSLEDTGKDARRNPKFLNGRSLKRGNCCGGWMGFASRWTSIAARRSTGCGTG